LKFYAVNERLLLKMNCSQKRDKEMRGLGDLEMERQGNPNFSASPSGF
jgi:hypothetical protein